MSVKVRTEPEGAEAMAEFVGRRAQHVKEKWSEVAPLDLTQALELQADKERGCWQRMNYSCG